MIIIANNLNICTCVEEQQFSLFYTLLSKEERNGKMEKEKFNQAKYMREWQKENMKQVKASYKTEFVDEFKEACKKLGIKQSDVFRKAMQDMIEKANNI